MTKKIFSVKSSSLFFDDELKGLKPNTSRFTDDWLPENWDSFYNATHIRVFNSDNNKNFCRVIKHKCTYRNLAIISWVN